MKNELNDLLNKYRDNNEENKNTDLEFFKEEIKQLFYKNFEKIKNEIIYPEKTDNEKTNKKEPYKKRINTKQAKSLFKKVHLYMDGSINRKSTFEAWKKTNLKLKKNQIISMIDWININVNNYQIDIESSLNNWKKEGFLYEKEK